MAFRIRRSSAIALVLSAVLGCALHHPVHAPPDVCWTSGAPTDYIVRDAANALIGSKGPTWDRMRALAAVPLVVDSIRARSRVLSEQTTCARLWLALDRDDRGARIAVVQIGETYWVRSGDGMRAFDNKFHQVAAFADL
jgi:hypothetical protein